MRTSSRSHFRAVDGKPQSEGAVGYTLFEVALTS